MKRRWHRHNQSHTRLYKIFDDLIQRCTNQNAINYDRYGGKGIKVCDEWRNDFRTFKAWADSQGYDDEAERSKERKDRLTLDRIDSSGNYCPENCRWSTYEQQIKNRSNTIRIKYAGEAKTLGEISEIIGIDYSILYRRVIKYGWPIDRALAK